MMEIEELYWTSVQSFSIGLVGTVNAKLARSVPKCHILTSI